MTPNCKDCPIPCAGYAPVQVHSEFVQDPQVIIVGEGPGTNEVLLGSPFVGQSGILLDKWLRRGKVDRSSCFITNAMLCKPNRPMKPNEWAQAIECCKGRLQAEIPSGDAPIITLGGRALAALDGPRNARGVVVVGDWVGELLHYKTHPLMPTYHPAFCLRSPGMIPAAAHLFERGLKLARKGSSRWTPRSFRGLKYYKSEHIVSTLRGILEDGLPIGVDVENNPKTEELICVGCGNTKRGASFPWPPTKEQMDLYQQCLLHLPCVYHNGQHDIILLENNGLRMGEYYWDTMLAASIYGNQQPKDLGHVAVLSTDLPRWKTHFQHDHGWGGSLEAYCKYNAEDNQGTAAVQKSQEGLLAATHKGMELFQGVMDLGQVAIRMRRWGVSVDDLTRQWHGVVLTKKMEAARNEFHYHVGDKYKLGAVGAHDSLKKLFFDDMGLNPLWYSKLTGERSLDAYTLEQYSICGNPKAELLAGIVLKYRKAGKITSTYIDNLPVQEDGRVHATWRVDGTLTGRWSCQMPNMTNQPKWLRDMYVPGPGMAFVSGDLSQAEVYAVAALSGDKLFLKWFAEGEDVHARNASTMFAIPITAVTKGMRKMAKIFIYCLVYGGTAETCWAQMRAGGFNVRLADVRTMFKRFFRDHPDIESFQKKLLADAQENCYVEEVLSGRREYFPDGRIDPSVILNYPEQAGVATIVNRAILALDRLVDWKTWGIWSMVHDEINLEVPMEDKVEAGRMLKKCLEQEVDFGTGPIVIPADIEWGIDWYNLKGLEL